jgi:hypothetical protein
MVDRHSRRNDEEVAVREEPWILAAEGETHPQLTEADPGFAGQRPGVAIGEDDLGAAVEEESRRGTATARRPQDDRAARPASAWPPASA